MVNPVARAPLHVERGEAGMTDQALVAGRGALEPVRKVATVTRAARALPRAVDEGELFDRRIRRIIHIVCGARERIAEDVERELLAVTGRAAVVRQENNE